MKVPNHVTRFRTDPSGVVAIVVALMFPVIIGFVALGVDVGYWYVTKRSAQTVADAAALAGAHELAKNSKLQSDDQEIEDAAESSAKSNGLDKAGGDTLFAGPPQTGPRAGDTDAVEAIVTRPATLFFSALLGAKVFNVEARAVSGLVENGSPACIVALAPGGGATLGLNGTPNINANGCAVQVNSTDQTALAAVGRGAKLTASDICVTGGFKGSSSNFSPQPATLCAPQTDPLAGLKAPSEVGLPIFKNVKVTKDTTLLPGIYQGGIFVTAGAKVIFEPGNYILKDGGLSLKGGSSVEGDGVGFYLTGNNADIDLSGGSDVDLSAPVSGDLKGLIFAQDPTSSGTHKFTGGNNTQLEGTIYFPSQTVNFLGNAAGQTSSPFVVIANEIKFSGTADYTFNGDFSGSKVPPPTNLFKKVVALLE